MTIKLNKNDRGLLAAIAEHRRLQQARSRQFSIKADRWSGGVSDNWKRQGSFLRLPEDWAIVGEDPKK